jgi:hypothetical protein
VQVFNNVSRTEHEKQQVAGGLILLTVMSIITLIVGFSNKSTEAYKWMDVRKAIEVLVPEAKADYVEAKKAVEHLKEELQMAQKESHVTADMVNVVPSDEQRRIDELQLQESVAEANERRTLNNIIQLLISKLKTGEIVATGYNQDQTVQHWECPTPSDWEDLKLSGSLTQTSITGGRSGRVHLTQARLRKPPIATGGGIAAEDSGKADHGPSRLCQGPGNF